MKCDNCPLLYRQCYYESYEIDEYCQAGIEDDDLVEFKDLSVGCRMPRNKIDKIARQIAQCRSCKHWMSESPDSGCITCKDNKNFEQI